MATPAFSLIDNQLRPSATLIVCLCKVICKGLEHMCCGLARSTELRLWTRITAKNTPMRREHPYGKVLFNFVA